MPSPLKKNHLAAIGKILVVRLSSIGDIILTTPLLRSLRNAYPEAHITYLTKKPFEELLSGSPHIDELITFESGEGLKGLKKIKHHIYYYWMVNHPDEIADFDRRYNDTYQLKYEGMLSVLKSNTL